MQLDSFKSFFGDKKEGTAIEIKMKKIRAFYDTAEGSPRPASAPSFIFQEHVLVLKAYLKTVFKSGRFTINNTRKNKPE